MNILWSGGGSQKGKVRKKIGWGEGNIFNLNNIQPEKQFKVCNICIFEEIDSFYWPKMQLVKKGKKFGQGVPGVPGVPP